MIYQNAVDHPPLDMRYLVKIPVSEKTVCIRKSLNSLNLSNFGFELSDELKLWLFTNVGRPYEQWIVSSPFTSELNIWFYDEPSAVLFKLTWG